MMFSVLSPVIALSVAVFGFPLLASAITPAPLFQDQAVLQHGKPIPVWGVAKPGENVTVSFQGQTKQTKSDETGRWTVTLDALEPTAIGSELVISGTDRVVVKDVVVGDVWLASGQSNMVWRVNSSSDAEREKAAAKWPQIREIAMTRAVADTPQQNAKTTGWRTAEPENIASFSAVAYYFARDVHQATGHPVGLITGAVGGTPIQSWLEPSVSTLEAGAVFTSMHERWSEVLANHPKEFAAYEKRLAKWEADEKAAKSSGQPVEGKRPTPPKGPGSPQAPSGLYNAMVAPVVPYAIRGILWYQGESDVRAPDDYPDLFRNLITGWRAAFAQGDLPFYWVQLANFRATPDVNWAWLREAQDTALSLPATGQVITIDVGDENDIHPGNKQSVGRRLAALVLGQQYGLREVPAQPAFLKSEKIEGGIRVLFAGVPGGLQCPSGSITGFEIAGEDQVFRPATGVLDGDSVLISSDDVSDPVAVRYAWQSAPKASLFNADGLPIAPFRTDKWGSNQ